MLGLGLIGLLAAAARAQENPDEVPVEIKEVDVEGAIKEFQDFEKRLEHYRKAVAEGRKTASDISEMLAELRKSANKENGFNEKEIVGAIGGYVDGVVRVWDVASRTLRSTLVTRRDREPVAETPRRAATTS